MPPTSDTAESSGSWKARLFCHYVISNLPEAALAEAVESLSHVWQFYRRLAPAPKALPAPPSIPARIGHTFTRPVYPVTEES